MTADGDGATVLVVEDEPAVADLYTGCLESAGYDVRAAHTVEAGVDRLGDHVDLALLDRRLPDGTGTDVLTAIHDRDLDVRVAMVTAVEPDFDIVEMGFDLYLLKPVSKEPLLDAVATLDTRREYDAKLRETAALASKRAILEVEKSPEELDSSDEYDALIDRIDGLDDELRALADDFTTEDYRKMFRDIGRV